MSIKQRIGKFYIPMHVIDGSPADVMEIMGQCVMLRAELRAIDQTIEYFAISAQFDEQPEGMRAPDYVWTHENGQMIARKA